MGKPLAVITGASSGIGLTFARHLAPQYDLLLIARRQEPLSALAKELSAKHPSVIRTLAADLSDSSQLNALAERISAERDLMLLVNNAGFGLRGPFWAAAPEVLEKMLRLHAVAIVRLTHAALRTLTERNRGAIINVASVAAFAQRPGSASYGASKAWLISFTEGLYLDLKKAQCAVTVQALCPGFTYSGFHDVMGEDRRTLAPASLWLSTEAVVKASLNGLERGAFLVVPGWRYKLLVAVVTKLPMRFKLLLEQRASKPARGAR
jgi:short-subunit dehydrogenase